MATKAELKALSEKNFFDNNNGEITPAKHRQFNEELIDSVATAAQGAKADTAVQSATVNGTPVGKSGTELQITGVATAAQGTKADTAVQSATVNGTPVGKSGTELQITGVATAAQGAKADTAIQSATINGTPVAKDGTILKFPALTADIPDNSITSSKIANGSVTKAKLGSDVSLTVSDNSITSSKIADRSITSAKMATGALGVVLAGTISAGGIVSVVYNPRGLSVTAQRTATGAYTLTHNVGGTPVIVATPYDTAAKVIVTALRSGSGQSLIYMDEVGGSRINIPISFIIIANNL